MTLNWKDASGSVVPLKSRTVSGEEVGAHDVLSMPGTMQSDVSSMNTLLGTLAGAISSARMAVDLSSTVNTYLSNLSGILTGINTIAGAISASRMAVDLSGTVSGYLSTLAGAVTAARVAVDLATTPTANLATLAGAVTSSRMAVNVDSTTTGKLDTLHTDLATTLRGKLDTLATNQGVPSGGPKCGQAGSIGTSADVQFTTQALTHGMVIKNISTSGQVLYLSHAATPTSSNGYNLNPGESTPFIEATNVTAIFMRASASGGVACYVGA